MHRKPFGYGFLAIADIENPSLHQLAPARPGNARGQQVRSHRGFKGGPFGSDQRMGEFLGDFPTFLREQVVNFARLHGMLGFLKHSLYHWVGANHSLSLEDLNYIRGFSFIVT